jgi:hypothetical protein
MDLSGILGGRRLVGLAAVCLGLAACSGGPGATAVVPLAPTVVLTALRPYTPPPPTETPVPPSPTTVPSPSPTMMVIPSTPSPWPTATSTPAPPTAIPSPTVAQPPTTTPQPALPEPAPSESDGLFINGLPLAAIAPMPPETAANVRAIFERGQAVGRDPRAFAKVGDSLVLTGHYLTRFDNGPYNLGPYAALQPVVDWYSGSFARYGVSSKVGLQASFATSPGLANGEWCPAEESMLACEFRLHNPSVVLVRVGTNDTIAATAFETAVRRLVADSIEAGVVPVLGTKSDRFEGDDRNNAIIRRVAAEMQVPLWDYDLAAGTLEDRGLSGDDVHLTVYKHNDYTDPETLRYGYPLSDLTALVALDAVQAALRGE